MLYISLSLNITETKPIMVRDYLFIWQWLGIYYFSCWTEKENSVSKVCEWKIRIDDKVNKDCG